MKRKTLISILLMVLLADALFSLPAMAEEQEQGQELPLAPDFSLKDMDGQRIALADLLGKGPILIDFWATWCKPCVKELPHLHDLYLKYRDRGFLAVAISEDTPRSLSKVKSFIAGNKYEFLVLLDDNGAVQRKFNFRAIPYTVLLDGGGHVVYSRMGYRPGDENMLEEKLLALLNAREESGGDDESSSVGDEEQQQGDEQAQGSPDERSREHYMKKVKGEETRKIEAEERDE